MVGHLYDFGQKKSTSTAPHLVIFWLFVEDLEIPMKFHDPTANPQQLWETTLQTQRCNVATSFSQTQRCNSFGKFWGCSQMLKPWGSCSGRFRFFIGSHAWRPEQLMMRVTLLATTNLTASFDCASIFPVFFLKKRTKRIQKVWTLWRTENVCCVLTDITSAHSLTSSQS